MFWTFKINQNKYLAGKQICVLVLKIKYCRLL